MKGGACQANPPCRVSQEDRCSRVVTSTALRADVTALPIAVTLRGHLQASAVRRFPTADACAGRRLHLWSRMALTRNISAAREKRSARHKPPEEMHWMQLASGVRRSKSKIAWEKLHRIHRHYLGFDTDSNDTILPLLLVQPIFCPNLCMKNKSSINRTILSCERIIAPFCF